jgi:hypothetical protein
MSQGTQKSLALRDELASELAVRISSIAQAKSFGSAGEARLALGAGTSDSDSVNVQIGTVDSIMKDVLGLSQNVFTPHVAKVGIEAAATGATWATRLAVIACLVAKGVRVELYERTHGTGPAFADLTAGNLKAVFEIHPQYPLMSSI